MGFGLGLVAKLIDWSGLSSEINRWAPLEPGNSVIIPPPPLVQEVDGCAKVYDTNSPYVIEEEGASSHSGTNSPCGIAEVGASWVNWKTRIPGFPNQVPGWTSPSGWYPVGFTFTSQGRSEGIPRTGYFVPACVWSGSWADFESCSRIGACAFRCFCRKVVFLYTKSVTAG